MNDPDLVSRIERFYIPENLVRSITRLGHIPASSQETSVGVAFLDIANYTNLSRFLSPKENQALLNGLYTAFKRVIEHRGGFLNKIEGDALMFQFDGILNAELRAKNETEKTAQIAHDLFYTCVDLQQVCVLFNQANDSFLTDQGHPEDRHALEAAFSIMKTLRGKEDISSTLLAFFQIRIRIGANLGEVTIGNFGPAGHKHWDIIGLPVINAKRMESTAPVGGLRISAEFFRVLEQYGITDEYYERFRKTAARGSGAYSTIKKEELFRYKEVVIAEKQGAVYETYAIQVFPFLPESIAHQTEALLSHGENGSREIVEFFRYYRGNRYVIDKLEQLLLGKGICLRKKELVETLYLCSKHTLRIPDSSSLFEIFAHMDERLDSLKSEMHIPKPADFLAYDQFMAAFRERTIAAYEQERGQMACRSRFSNIAIPLIYGSLEASIREWQLRNEAAEEETELLEDIEEISGS